MAAMLDRHKEDLMDQAGFQRWLDAYVSAWQSYDGDAIGALFTDDAEYLYHPWDPEPVKGREAIVKDWLGNKDEPGSWRASYTATSCAEGICVATGTSEYLTDDRLAVDRFFYNVFLCRFDDGDQCSSFTEYYMERPKPKSS
jgi:ketosteroid isomerase-like protein